MANYHTQKIHVTSREHERHYYNALITKMYQRISKVHSGLHVKKPSSEVQ